MGKRTEIVPGRDVERSAASWRLSLLERARGAWSSAADAQSDQITIAPAQPCKVLKKALGPLAGEARDTVDAYILGARRSVSGSCDKAIPHEVQNGLDLILRGIACKLDDKSRSHADHESPLVIQLELWQLLRKVRESAELSYARVANLIDLDRRILIMLYNNGPSVPADIASSAGVDKAQVSRSIKRLLDLRMLDRKQIRSPLSLTGRGKDLAQRLVRHAKLRNRELTFEIGDSELADFFDAISILLDRAVALFDQEREIAQGSCKAASSAEPSIQVNLQLAPDRTQIIPPLLTLSSYFGRSGALAFKRLTGLSKFEAFVLQAIASAPPIDWCDLVASLRRDHSQAGRTVNALMDRKLVKREGKPGRRHGRFLPTAEGKKVDAIIRKSSSERSTFLLAPLGEEAQERFFATLAKISRNASAQLEREKAMAEQDRSS